MTAATVDPPRPRLTQYRQLENSFPLKRRLRNTARKSAIFLMSLASKIPPGRQSVSFPMYHHVFDDERQDFARHLRFLRNHGDLIGVDDALKALTNPAGVGGTYFCITFDDGFRNCFTNAMPILVEHKAPAAFFLPTDYIGKDLDRDWETTRRFFETSGYDVPIEFLTWDECRQMQSAGMTIGAHTCGHVRISELDRAAVERELRESKSIIERELGRPCEHFACPWGRPGLDFDPAVHPQIAREFGYKSFLTTRRGPNYAGTDPFALKRENFFAFDGDSLLRYFLAKAN
jgi:peptidoglycan/xylan/chitin deacetylase (PgdA/CDA1 family)